VVYVWLDEVDNEESAGGGAVGCACEDIVAGEMFEKAVSGEIVAMSKICVHGESKMRMEHTLVA
jgi:hypothetical protein